MGDNWVVPSETDGLQCSFLFGIFLILLHLFSSLCGTKRVMLSVGLHIGHIVKSPGRMTAQEVSLGMAFVEEKQSFPPASLVLSVTYSTKLSIGQWVIVRIDWMGSRDDHMCRSALHF